MEHTSTNDGVPGLDVFYCFVNGFPYLRFGWGRDAGDAPNALTSIETGDDRKTELWGCDALCGAAKNSGRKHHFGLEKGGEIDPL